MKSFLPEVIVGRYVDMDRKSTVKVQQTVGMRTASSVLTHAVVEGLCQTLVQELRVWQTVREVSLNYELW